MKKLSLIFATALLIAQPYHAQANDEWSLVYAPLALTGGALILCAYHMHNQATKISLLEQKLTKKKTLIKTLTQERDALKGEQEEAKKLSTWSLMVKKLCECIPFLCAKESCTTAESQLLLTDLGFERSAHRHKIQGLVTYISKNPGFTHEEKNMVSDEEDSLEEKEHILGEISDVVAGLKQKIGGFNEDTSN